MIMLAFLIGIIARLRAIMAPAAVSWAADPGRLDFAAGWLVRMGHRFTPWLFTVAAIGERITDQWPSTPSRKVPSQFSARIILGTLCGAPLGHAGGSLVFGLVAGALCAVVGMLGGSAARGALMGALGSHRSAALSEDAVAIFGAPAIISLV